MDYLWKLDVAPEVVGDVPMLTTMLSLPVLVAKRM